MFSFIKRLFGFRSSYISKITDIVNQINSKEEVISSLSDQELKGYTDIFKDKLKSGISLDDILIEAFAVVRESAKRVLGMRHFDVQLLGGIVLHKGMIAEMLTGEGKTLVATLPAYLNALTGRGVHVVTVNDYLAKRDSHEMGEVYRFLGMTVGCITNDVSEKDRKQIYRSDIVYGTNNEFVFDYLKDNLKDDCDQIVQNGYNFAIVDEVDSILIDEGRVPVNISSRVQDAEKLYVKINDIVSRLKEEDYLIEEGVKAVTLTELGSEKIEKMLKSKGLIKKDCSLYDVDNMILVHHVMQALNAVHLFKKDVDYIKKDDRIFIVDEFTGRVLKDRRYSEGLHQAIEAKEGVKIQSENSILASITFQNYFRMYNKLSGMTGTAMTEAVEFRDIYKLEVVQIPPHKPVIRIDEDDEVYKTEVEKYDRIVKEVEKYHEMLVPILIGTTSIEKSEYVSSLLKKRKIKHNVLNAKHHAAEAAIIAQAGRLGAVTVATNMAGRGTDIVLGGKPTSRDIPDEDELSKINSDKMLILEKGGAYVIGTERHSARRIDNQLRGRVGRQGDPGRSKFFLSLEDDLMKSFGSDKMGGLLDKMGLESGEAITHPWITKAVEKAQQRLEGKNYEIRKSLLQFDDILNQQRQVIYAKRLHVMNEPSVLSDELVDMSKNVNAKIIDDVLAAQNLVDESFIERLKGELTRIYGHGPEMNFISSGTSSVDDIRNIIDVDIAVFIENKKKQYDKAEFENILKSLFLFTIDYLWMEHINTLETVRAGISLRVYSNKDPLIEYSVEAYNLFQSMLLEIQVFIIQKFSHLHDKVLHDNTVIDIETLNANNMSENRSAASSQGKKVLPDIIKRNALCYCNSGKKYKHCHGIIR